MEQQTGNDAFSGVAGESREPAPPPPAATPQPPVEPAPPPEAPTTTPPPPPTTPPPLPPLPPPQIPQAQPVASCPYLPPQINKPRRFGCLLAGLTAFLVFVFCMFVFGVIGSILSEGPENLLAAAAHAEKAREELVDGEHGGSDRKIAVIEVSGVIVADAGLSRRSAGGIIRGLQLAAADSSVAAVILEINSPGGEVTACDEIHHHIQKLREAGKPVISCMRSMAASGGYLIAAGTDHIIANRLTITGSIGVMIPAFNYAEMLKKIGVSTAAFTSGDMKDMLSGGRDWTDKEKAYVQDMVDKTFGEFAQIVADGRSQFADRDAVLAAPFADGRILSGSEALDLGLIDQLGYPEDAYAKARELAGKPGAPVIRYRQPLRLSEFLFSSEARGTELQQQLKGLLPEEWLLVRPGNMYYLLPSVLP